MQAATHELAAIQHQSLHNYPDNGITTAIVFKIKKQFSGPPSPSHTFEVFVYIEITFTPRAVNMVESLVLLMNGIISPHFHCL